MSEGVPEMPSAKDIANARADELRAKEIEQQEVTMPSAQEIANAKADAVVEKLRAEEEKAQQSAPATEPEATETAPAAESPVEKNDPFDIPQEQGAEGSPTANYFANRSEGLNKEAGKYGAKMEGLFRSLGEKYNKLNWKYKLAISAGLIAGVGFSAAGSIPALVAGYGLIAQRGTGMAGMYVKFENHLQKTAEGKADGYWAKKEWYKKLAERPGWQRKAMAGVMAAGYTGLMSFGIHEAIGVIRGDESWGGQLHEWLKHHWSFGHTETVAPAPGTTMPHTETTPSMPGVTAPEMPDISVEASDGHGYEYMMKRMWEQLQEKGLTADQYPEGSDIRQLLDANKDTIDGVVHRLAADQDHGFFNADGTSVQIDPSAHMTIDADGDITIGDAMHDTAMHAPEGAATTPAYHAEASAEGGGDSSVPNETGEPGEISQESGATPEDDYTPKEAREKLKKMINDFFNQQEQSPDTRVHSSAQIPIDEAVAAPDTVPPDTSGAFYDVQPQPPIEDHATTAPPQPEADVAPAPETSHFVVNAHGLSIDASHAGTYMDTQGNHIIYGGTLDEKAELARQWAAKDHSAVVFFESTRSEKFLGLFNREVPHLSMAQWVDAGAESGVRIAEDTNDPSLVGILLPTVNDLAQVYKPTTN